MNATIASRFSVRLPKTITLDGSKKSASYKVTCEGDFPGNQKVVAVPDAAVTLSSNDKADVVAPISQDKTEWLYNESNVEGNGSVNAAGITAGDWNGVFNFNISLDDADVSGHVHAYSETITKQPTCTEDGEKTLTCECGDTKTAVIPATGHNYVDGECTECHKVVIPDVAPVGAIADWKYSINNGSVLLEKYINTEKRDVIVYDSYEIDGVTYPTVFAHNAVQGNYKILSVAFGDNVVTDTLSFNSMFYSCTRLTKIDFGGLTKLKPTDMSRMFSNCYELTDLDVSGFDTSNVTDMHQMFYSLSKLTDLDVSNFDTSNVTNMRSMFNDCEVLTRLDVSNFDTSKVTDMQAMFDGCRGIANLDLSNFDTSNVTDMSYMFAFCDVLADLNLSSFDTSNVTTVARMFSKCPALASLDLSSFDTHNVTVMGNMFSDCPVASVKVTTGKWTLNAADIDLGDGILQYN